ncbi:glycosyltransferase [Xinfangfangia sp. CPCC 101601]|uniref:Glycosyltransferase n=1 Tax=Pseudogemmobacter lacusdianii TaxID=3069608 RepID=A0ABU0VZS2_9RHOB|nr:class I SAM-dependent methyltransferase [Xinfangfangia sp. CPCC 101601]MDQ2067261.1 glycosyltransferase [Xinfangfangia sp. CPCC 101601]
MSKGTGPTSASSPASNLHERVLAAAFAANTAYLTDVVSWHAHVPFAHALIDLLTPALVVELGVHQGDSLLSIAAALQHFGQAGKVTGIDTWEGDDHAGSYDGNAVFQGVQARAAALAPRVTLLRATFDKALPTFADGSVDLLHIDGLHTYDAVRHDFESWRPKLSPRSVVMLHDTAVRSDDFGVYRLWEEIAHLGPSYNFSFGNGLGVLALGAKVPADVLHLLDLLAHDQRLTDTLTAIGEALEGRSMRRALLARTKGLETELDAMRKVASDEISRLNSEHTALTQRAAQRFTGLEAERDAALQAQQRLQDELDALTARNRVDAAEFAQEHARLEALIEADRCAARIEIDRLNRAYAVLQRDSQAALQAARLKSRALRAVKSVGRPLFHALPLSRQTKQRLRLSLIAKHGAALELVPSKAPQLASQTQVALRPLAEDLLALARAATGVPENLPARSASLIIPVFNQIDYTLRCIEAIQRNTTEIEYEIIVVDDGSTDATQSLLSGRADITYLRNAENLGFIGSCNAGLARARNTYVCYLNNDTEVAPLWLSALIDSFELHPGIGMAGAQLIYPDGRLQEAGGIIWDDFSGWNWGRLQDPEAAPFTYARQADYCSGAAILLPRALAQALGGFDPSFAPAYGEDSDLAFRLRAIGLATLYQPLSRVVHYEGITSGTDTSTGVKAYQLINAEKLKARWAHVLPHQGANGVDAVSAVDRGRIGRILVLDQITPEPDKDAGSITALELMLALRDLGYKVSFIPCSNFTYIPRYTELLGGLGIESLLYPAAKSVEDHLRQAGDSYDAVVIFRVNTATDHLAAIQRHAPRAKVIFHNSDLHFLREERALGVANPNVAERNLSPAATKKRELSVIARANVTIVHSQFEAALLAEYVPQVPVVVFPWVYEPRGPGADFAARQDVVFLGGYRHYPNVDAVLHYAQNIAPLIAAELPQLRFRAIGSHAPPEMQALASDQLVIEGFVADLAPALSQARVMLVPLRYGAGLKGKIITAMAHGLPVVTTSIGAEGMGLQHGENVLIADSPDEIAKALVSLYTDQALWTRLSQAGLAFVAATTSRAQGARITRRILQHAGLPALPLATPPKPQLQHLMPAGTPPALHAPPALAHAARSALGLPPQAELCLWLPPDIAATSLWQSTEPGLTVAPIGTTTTAATVLLVDTFDDPALATALALLPPSPQLSAILFLPPKLTPLATGYDVTHALSQKPLAEGSARTPVHLRHAEAIAAMQRPFVWLADRSLTGFPGLTLLRFA